MMLSFGSAPHAFALKEQVANVRPTFHVRLLCSFPLAPLHSAALRCASLGSGSAGRLAVYGLNHLSPSFEVIFKIVQ